MKTQITSGTIVLIVLFSFASCKKDPGTGGKKEIKGTVTYPGGAAAGAKIKIAYGAKEATTSFNAEVAADGSGVYSIPDLTKGDYYIDAVYTDSYGITYNTAGSHVFIGKKRGEVVVDFSLTATP